MSTNSRYKSEVETLELYKISLYNAVKQPDIQLLLDEVGYGAEKIAEGNSILNETREAYEHNQTEDDETNATYQLFKDKREALDFRFRKDRKLAKVLFRDNPVVLEQLKVTGQIPITYSAWIDRVKTFYIKATEEEEINLKLGTLKLTPDKLEEGLNAVFDVEMLRANYLREVGESQDATTVKDNSFKELDRWMSDFYTVAKIALEDKPQLLEALGKVVKN